MASYEVDHLGVVVPNLEAGAAFYRDVLGCPVSEPVVLEGQGIAIVFVHFRNLRIELIAPTVDHSPIVHLLEDHTVNDFLARHPAGGLHHVCYVVDELKTVRDRLRASGHRTLGSGEPIIGASGQPILFLDPRSASGTLIELKQRARSTEAAASAGMAEAI
ncbi:MAG: VOC family protein [Hyphomicrobiales bacterium]|nr:VOC family protein [Hyphomicrobiales bacterium]